LWQLFTTLYYTPPSPEIVHFRGLQKIWEVGRDGAGKLFFIIGLYEDRSQVFECRGYTGGEFPKGL
jgi:hypothetical protein